MLIVSESDHHRLIAAPSHYGRFVRRAVDRCTPLNVLIELTHRCHLDCVHCYLEDNHDYGAKPRELTEAEWCGFIDELAAAGGFFVTFSGGEIFLRRDTLTIARHARRRGLAVRFYTSGTLMPPALAEELAALQPLSVEFSLYAADDADRHDAIVGAPGSHRKTLEAIRCLRALGVSIVIKTPLMREIFLEYPKIIRLAESLGATYLLDPAITPKNDGTSSPCHHRVTAEQLTALYADGALPTADEIRRLQTGVGRRDPDGDVCNLGKTGCAISPFGDVHPTLGFPWSAGNIREAPFAMIWRDSPLFNKLRAVKVRDLHTCAGCEKNAYCNRCCMWALMDDGDFFGGSSWACEIAAAKERAAGLPSRPTPHEVNVQQPAALVTPVRTSF